jgi:hypothetical protein
MKSDINVTNELFKPQKLNSKNIEYKNIRMSEQVITLINPNLTLISLHTELMKKKENAHSRRPCVNTFGHRKGQGRWTGIG